MSTAVSAQSCANDARVVSRSFPRYSTAAHACALYRGRDHWHPSPHVRVVKGQLSLFFPTTLRGGRRPRKSLRSTRLANFSFFVPTTPPVACKRLRPTPCPAPQPIRADHARCAHRKTDFGLEVRAPSGVSHRSRHG